MTIQAVTTKIISTLGNKDSLIPVMIKDGTDSTCLTVKSFKEGGFAEGKDRAVDEFGTQAVWIGGIPLFKKIADKTIYKAAKLNPAVDPRIIADKEYSSWAVKNAAGFMSNDKTQTVKSALEDCLKDGGEKAKNLYKTKVVAATALTLGTFFMLTKLKQKDTKDTILKKLNSETKSKPVSMKGRSQSDVFINFNKEENQDKSLPSFKGAIKKVTEAIMFNPVHNMQVIDAGITTERIGCSRNKTEFAEHTIKEGSFLFFIYGFGNLIDKGINKFSQNVLKKPIDLKIDVLTDKTLEKALSAGTIKEDLKKLPESGKSLVQKLDFLKNNPNNIIVKAAKSAGVVKTVEAGGKKVIDTSSFIDFKEVENIAGNLKNIDDCFQKSGETAKKFINKTKGLKVGSTLLNIGISCFILGYGLPKAIYAYRKHKTGTTKFHVEEDLKKKVQK